MSLLLPFGHLIKDEMASARLIEHWRDFSALVLFTNAHANK